MAMRTSTPHHYNGFNRHMASTPRRRSLCRDSRLYEKCLEKRSPRSSTAGTPVPVHQRSPIPQDRRLQVAITRIFGTRAGLECTRSTPSPPYRMKTDQAYRSETTLQREQTLTGFQEMIVASRILPEAVSFATPPDELGSPSQNLLGTLELVRSRMDDPLNRVSYHQSRGLQTVGRRSGGRWQGYETATWKRIQNPPEDAD
ncbi:hypothetical protein BR93DRAFT_966095 [Coniochaeta sp. PMI_546]|nr:hypothetical protein BR93DRAFT_966095 [Coniochaeta sp. PMI_546]